MSLLDVVYSVGVFIYLSKAFDRVGHKALRYNLNTNGV